MVCTLQVNIYIAQLTSMGMKGGGDSLLYSFSQSIRCRGGGGGGEGGGGEGRGGGRGRGGGGEGEGRRRGYAHEVHMFLSPLSASDDVLTHFLTLKNGCFLISSASLSLAPSLFSGFLRNNCGDGGRGVSK